MACEPEVGRTHAIGGWLGGVFGVVEDKDLRRHRLGGNEEGVLRHVPRPIYLPLMVDLLNHLCNTTRAWLEHDNVLLGQAVPC